MANFRITQDVVCVDVAFLKKPVKLPLVDVSGTSSHEMYFHCISANTSLHRLLVADAYVTLVGSAAAALRKTDILKTLKQLKDDEWSKQLAALNYTAAKRRYTKGGMRAKVLAFSPTVSIVAPRVSTVESIAMLVELSKPTKGLVMLLKPEHIEYLRNVVSAQLEIGVSSTVAHVRNNMEVADRVDTDVPNVFWSYELNKYRAAFYPPDADGKKKQRCEDLTDKMESAARCVETGIRPKDSVGWGLRRRTQLARRLGDRRWRRGGRIWHR